MPRSLQQLNRILTVYLAALACWLLSAPAIAQDLEPRRWTHLPAGTSSLAVGYAGQEAEIFFNPLIGITNGTANLNAWLARYSYVFDWSGMTARVDGMLPYVSGTWQGLVDGEPGRRTTRAGGDPWLRLSVSFYGAPALARQEFTDYIAENPVRTTLGASLAVSLPLGGYDPEELINIGRNRYTLRPQIGVLHMRGPWSLELTGSVFFFSENKDFVDSISLSQEPVFALQGHLTRNFEGGFWLGAGGAYAAGGKVDLNGVRTTYEVDNVLWNLVGGYRVTDRQSVMIAWQQGRTQVDVGTDSDGWLLSWAYAWGH
jgi:hypothetical protein